MSPDAEVYLRAVVRGHGLSRITWLSRDAVVKSKNRDKQLTHIVRVRGRIILILRSIEHSLEFGKLVSFSKIFES
jgi:hypothetical protein